jgi:hypothetical protein
MKDRFIITMALFAAYWILLLTFSPGAWCAGYVICGIILSVRMWPGAQSRIPLTRYPSLSARVYSNVIGLWSLRLYSTVLIIGLIINAIIAAWLWAYAGRQLTHYLVWSTSMLLVGLATGSAVILVMGGREKS